jgi:hypothetical protein
MKRFLILLALIPFFVVGIGIDPDLQKSSGGINKAETCLMTGKVDSRSRSIISQE